MMILNFVYGFIYMIYSLITRFFLQYAILIGAAIFTREYYILSAFVLARIICFIITHLVNIVQLKHYSKKYNVPIGDVEITAAKLLIFYSDENLNFKRWLIKYSDFIHAD